MLTGVHPGQPPAGLPATHNPQRHFPQQTGTRRNTRTPDASSLPSPTQVESLWTCLPQAPSAEASLLHRVLDGYVNLSLHGVAMNAIRSLGSDEQIAKWGQLCKNFQIITTYAQTELGHGEWEVLRAMVPHSSGRPFQVHRRPC